MTMLFSIIRSFFLAILVFATLEVYASSDLYSRSMVLVPRQATKNTTALPADAIPAACADSCSADTVLAITSCTKESCTCGDRTDAAITTCMDCVIQQGVITADLGNAVKTQYETTCTARGIQLASVVNGSRGTEVKMGTGMVAVLGVMMVLLL